MEYIDSNQLYETQFKRYTGISYSIFNLLVKKLKMHVPAKGRTNKLSIEGMLKLLM
jgi:hypothetical protein